MIKNFPTHLFLAQMLVVSTLSALGWPWEVVVLCCVNVCMLYVGVRVE